MFWVIKNDFGLLNRQNNDNFYYLRHYMYDYSLYSTFIWILVTLTYFSLFKLLIVFFYEYYAPCFGDLGKVPPGWKSRVYLWSSDSANWQLCHPSTSVLQLPRRHTGGSHAVLWGHWDLEMWLIRSLET